MAKLVFESRDGVRHETIVQGLGAVLVATDSNNFNVPAFMQMEADRAEELTRIPKSQNDNNHIYFGAHVRVLDVTLPYGFDRQLARAIAAHQEMPRYEVWKFVTTIEVKSLALYVDAELSRLIRRYDAAPPIKAQ